MWKCGVRFIITTGHPFEAKLKSQVITKVTKKNVCKIRCANSSKSCSYSSVVN